MEHLKDFVWMSKGGEEPVQVEATVEEISRRMVAGYVQVFPAVEAVEETEENK